MLHIELVEQCKANDRRAQLRLYEQYCQGMFNVAMRFLRDQDDAEDVLQESFIKAFQKIDQFKGEVTFGAWLKRIVVNRSIDFLKSKHQKTIELNEGYMHITEDDDFDKIENGIHLRTGFAEGEGLMVVVNNCTNCHSAKLVTQNRMSIDGWRATIKWMQETQNLWDLGKNEDIIINYLATYYAPESKGRRQNLNNIEWYELKN